MKTLTLLIILVVTASVISQAQTSSSSASEHSAAPSISTVTATVQRSAPPVNAAPLAADAVVITIQGICDKQPANGPGHEGCVTNITRDQFERMLAAMSFNPQMLSNPAAVRGFAESYVQALVQAHAAEQVGFDRDPNFQELMNIIRVRALSEAYRRFQQESANNVPAQELDTYYHEHVANYEQVELDRIFIPRVSSKPTNEDKSTFEKKARQLADRMQARAAKGEDMLKLQVEASKELGLTPPLSTDMGAIRRGKLSSAVQGDIFSAHADEATKVEEDAAGFTIYKVRTRAVLPLERVKDEIIHAIAQTKLDASMKAIASQVHSELNDQFFTTQHSALPLRSTVAHVQK